MKRKTDPGNQPKVRKSDSGMVSKVILSFLLLFCLELPAFAQVKVNTVLTAAGQREPSIAVDASGRVYVMWIDATTSKVHYSVSTDNGATWTDKFPAGSQGVDPTSDTSGNSAFACWLSSPITCSRTDDGLNTLAATWNIGLANADKPFIKVGNQGQVYYTWAGYSYPAASCALSDQAAQIYFARSFNNGPSLSVNRILTYPVLAQLGRCTNAPIAVAPNNKIYITLTCFSIDQAACDGGAVNPINGWNVYLARSDDGGRKFRFFRNLNIPQPSSNGYMTFAPVTPIKWLGWVEPAVTTTGNVALLSSCESGTDVDICLDISTNEGVAFSRQTANDDGADAYHFFSAIATDSSGIHIEYVCSCTTGLVDPPAWEVRRRDFTSAGVASGASVRVSTGTFSGTDPATNSDSLGYFNSMTAKGGHVYDAWTDATSGNSDVYVLRE